MKESGKDVERDKTVCCRMTRLLTAKSDDDAFPLLIHSCDLPVTLMIVTRTSTDVDRLIIPVLSSSHLPSIPQVVECAKPPKSQVVFSFLSTTTREAIDLRKTKVNETAS